MVQKGQIKQTQGGEKEARKPVDPRRAIYAAKHAALCTAECGEKRQRAERKEEEKEEEEEEVEEEKSGWSRTI